MRSWAVGSGARNPVDPGRSGRPSYRVRRDQPAVQVVEQVGPLAPVQGARRRAGRSAPLSPRNWAVSFSVHSLNCDRCGDSFSPGCWRRRTRAQAGSMKQMSAGSSVRPAPPFEGVQHVLGVDAGEAAVLDQLLPLIGLQIVHAPLARLWSSGPGSWRSEPEARRPAPRRSMTRRRSPLASPTDPAGSRSWRSSASWSPADRRRRSAGRPRRCRAD